MPLGKLQGSVKTEAEQISTDIKPQLSRIESEPFFATRELEDSLRSTGNLLDSDYQGEHKKSKSV